MPENQDTVDFSDDVKPTDQELDAVALFKDIDPSSATPEQVTKVIKTGRTLLVQKRHWREKAQKPSVPAVNPSHANAHDAPDGDASGNARLAKLELAEEKRQFGYAHGLSPEETDSVFAYAHGAQLKPDEALDKPFIKSGIAALRSAQRASDATPTASHRSPKVEGKTFTEMSPDDRRKNFGQVVQGLRK